MILFKHLLGRNLVKVKDNNKFISKGKVRQSKIKIYGENNELNISSLAKIRNCTIEIQGVNNKIFIEHDCDINNTTFSMDNAGGSIYIRKGTSIGRALIVSYEPNIIDIGNNCMISYDVEIRNTDSHAIFSLGTKKRINYGKDVKIGNNVWIGAYSKILKGSTIEANTIIGMSSLVSGYIPENCIAVGSPAKVIKDNVYWDQKLI